MERKGSLLERTSELLDIPRDIFTGLPRIELLGDREVRMECHKGILSYGSEEIHISGGKLVVRVRGRELELRAMDPVRLLITGQIESVDFS